MEQSMSSILTFKLANAINGIVNSSDTELVFIGATRCLNFLVSSPHLNSPTFVSAHLCFEQNKPSSHRKVHKCPELHVSTESK